MSSTGQTTSSASNVQVIVDALADYAKITGIDLSESSVVATLEQSNSAEAILQLLQGRETAFKEYRGGNRRLIGYLSPVVRILQAFSGILGETVNLVGHSCRLVGFFKTRSRQIPFPPASVLFAGIDTLLSVRPFDMPFKRFPFDE